ncbi:hypothetical protein EVAR_66880_1 [Eumeta japonica]|uniref:Uncharacterized protein n=1 Tax=Eumeta variegata TaxID=151549 RepID=A0A4C1ZWI4_EUMVA|nr:hypothetical protein EVAR_66880_1 [Eumeta japonica]
MSHYTPWTKNDQDLKLSVVWSPYHAAAEKNGYRRPWTPATSGESRVRCRPYKSKATGTKSHTKSTNFYTVVGCSSIRPDRCHISGNDVNCLDRPALSVDFCNLSTSIGIKNISVRRGG